MDNCQSCGMPMDINTKSKWDEKYCIYCQNQETGDLATYEQVKEGSINAAMKHLGKSKQEAEIMADEMLPKLPRWVNNTQ